FRVDPATGDATTIQISDGQGGTYSVSAGDGLYVHGGTIYVVRNVLNTVAKIALGPGLKFGLLLEEITSTDFSVPTTATVAAGRLWAVNARFGVMPPPTTFWVTQVPACGYAPTAA